MYITSRVKNLERRALPSIMRRRVVDLYSPRMVETTNTQYIIKTTKEKVSYLN